MRFLLIFILPFMLACTNKTKQPQELERNLRTVLDSIWTTEQEPIRKRDSLMEIYGIESDEAQKQQLIYERNHALNEIKIKEILDKYGWPEKSLIGEEGNLTICNVLQHSDYALRIKYLPLMKKAVKAQKLHARFLVRAEDRIATDRGELQIYGGQMKYYPETQSFNVWPVYDPANIDKRRAEIGLGPIAEHLKNRFNFEWNLEAQIQRSAIFEAERIKNKR